MYRTHTHAFNSHFEDPYKKMRFSDSRNDFVDRNEFYLPPISSLIASIAPPVLRAPTMQPAQPAVINRLYHQTGMKKNIIDTIHSAQEIAHSPLKYHDTITTTVTESATIVVKSPTRQSRPISPVESSSDDDSQDEDENHSPVSFTSIPTVENPKFNYHQLQPIRILAYQVGISKDANKSWRYRDIKRSLIDKSSKDQLGLIDADPHHTILRQRLPHKLTLAQFCKRLMLLVFHFIVKDGREPKFWRKKNVRQDLIKRILMECESDFYKCVNIRVATLLHSYVSAGMTVTDSLSKISQDGNMNH